MFTNHTLDKGHLHRISEELLKTHKKKINTQLKNKRLKQSFFPKKMETANKHMKRCSTSFAVRRRKSKRGWEATSRPLGWLLSKANNCWGARGETRALTRCCWKQSARVASASSPAAPTGGEQRPLDAAVLLLGIYSGQLKTSVHAKIYVNVHSSYIHNKQKSGNNPNGHQQVNG